jgi:hypothetical protein
MKYVSPSGSRIEHKRPAKHARWTTSARACRDMEVTMARKFFYVCAGVFLLALSYHLGAGTAGAQSGGTVEGAQYCMQGGIEETLTFAVGRTLYYFVYVPNSGRYQAVPVGPPIPGTAPVATTSGQGPILVLLANGDAYDMVLGSGAWVYRGNLLGGAPIPTLRQSWGQVKSRYAPSHSPTSQTPAGR